MSRIAVAVAVVGLFVLGSYLLQDGPLKSGTVAPAWKLSRVNGAQDAVSMEGLRGKVVILDFWSTSCPPCLMQIPVLQRLQQRFPNDVTVVGVAVGGETPAQLQRFATARKMTYAVVADLRGIAATAYNVSRLPTLFVVDRDGVIAASHEGFWEEQSLLQVIAEEVGR